MSGITLYLKWRYFKWRRRLIHRVCASLYRDTNRDIRRSMVVAGVDRSGTTWLANIIASQIPSRLMFEPFNLEMVEAYSPFHYYQYMRPEEKNSELFEYCRKIFSGDIRHRWIDSDVSCLLPRFRIVKAVRANLVLRWIHNEFPEIPLLFIVRHPCAVVLARMQLGWPPDTDLERIFIQPKVVEDFLAEKKDIFERANSVEEKHALHWCIGNLVPLRQFLDGRLAVIFYERLCLQPQAEIQKVFRAIQQEYHDSVFAMLDQPSAMAVRSSAVFTGADKVTRWRNVLSPKQVHNILRVVEDFGLDYIYGDSSEPLVADSEVTGSD